jgi:hypothetical protein
MIGGPYFSGTFHCTCRAAHSEALVGILSSLAKGHMALVPDEDLLFVLAVCQIYG